MLLQQHLKSSILDLHRKPASRKCILNRCSKCLIRSNLENSLQCRGKVAAVMVQYRSEGANLRDPRRRILISPEMVVESPAAHCLANSEHLRSPLRIGDTGKHTVGVREVLR